MELSADWVEQNIVLAPYVIAGNNPYDAALRTKESQVQRWRNLLTTIRQAASDTGFSNYYQNYGDDRSFSAHQSHDGAEVRSSLPIIISDVPTANITLEKQYEVLAAIAPLLGRSSPNQLPDSLRLLAAFEARSREKYIEFTTDIQDRVVAAGLQEQKELAGDIIAELRTALEDLRADGKAVILDISRKHEQAVAAFRDDTNSVQNQLNRLNNEVKTSSEISLETIQGLRAAQSELLEIKPTVELWKERGVDHQRRYNRANRVFVLVIMASVAAIIAYGPDYARNVALATDGQPVIAAALFATPALMLAWVLRLVSRYALTNLSLWQDALQRQATAATYLGLLSEPEKPISKEERALALNALFRGAPGSPEDVHPPNFVDLLRGKLDN